ncbi:unnamed protein product, partial [Ectocarpus sp. 6 AP-2014]
RGECCARGNGCPWDEVTCSNAPSGGQLGVLQWVGNSGRPWDGGAYIKAALGGHLGLLQWAGSHGCSHGCQWDEETCSSANRGGTLKYCNGHFEVFQWARRNGCPCDEAASSNAASGRHLEALQWARNNRCP